MLQYYFINFFNLTRATECFSVVIIIIIIIINIILNPEIKSGL